jgi:predicted ATP-dependent endonuclease of OLD family
MIYDFKASGNYFKLDFDIQLEKDQQVYCFIGENGVGKTKLLQTMTNIMIYRHVLFSGKIKNIVKNPLFEFGSHNLISEVKDLELLISDFIKINNGFGESQDLHSGINTIQLKQVVERMTTWRDMLPSDHINKPLVFISAKHRGYITGIEDNGMMNLPTSRKQNFIDNFLHTYNSINDRHISNDSVTNWLLQRVMINRSIPGTEKLYSEALFVLNCLQQIAPELVWIKQDNGSVCDNFSYDDGKLLISGIPIEGLSTGYASILRIIQEIVAGLSAWDLENNIDLHDADGIVFIDEIDLHLHPKWQFKIIDLLKEFFPKVTFYITTHSPLILFNLKNGEGYRLNKDEKNLVTAQKVEQSNMQFIGDIIKQFFDVNGVSIRKIDEDKMKHARKNLLDFIKENQDEQ